MNKLKRYISYRIVHQFPWRKSNYQSQSRYIPYFFYPICTEPEFSVDPR